MSLPRFALVAALCLSGGAAQAATTIGTFGLAGPDGTVTAPPGGGAYAYVSTNGGVTGAGQIAGVGGSNGSSWTSDGFAAAAGALLTFHFTYVTSDGSGFADYAWAELLDGSLTSLGFLFTARTVVAGDVSPGFGLPANISTLTPASSPILAGAPSWFALGTSSGLCWAEGCGQTGWIRSDYILPADGTYVLRFGVTNWEDTDYQSGLAWSGARIGDIDLLPVPLPGGLPLLAGVALLGGAARGRDSRRA